MTVRWLVFWKFKRYIPPHDLLRCYLSSAPSQSIIAPKSVKIRSPSMLVRMFLAPAGARSWAVTLFASRNTGTEHAPQRAARQKGTLPLNHHYQLSPVQNGRKLLERWYFPQSNLILTSQTLNNSPPPLQRSSTWSCSSFSWAPISTP